MAEIVNLRQARKRKDRTAAEREAADNRTRFGRSKAEREAKALSDDRAARLLEGHRLEPQSE